METVILLLLFLVVISAVIACCHSDSEVGSCASFVALAFTLSLIIVSSAYDPNSPSAMDVYQGKTTLDYTIVDGVKVDSCVIWKK